MTNNGLGKMVRAGRKKLAMNGSQLAKKLGVSRQFVSQVELGLCRLTNRGRMVRRLARALKLDAGKLQTARPRRRLCQRRRNTPLGEFLTRRRLALGLNLAQVARRAERSLSSVARVELAYYHPSPLMLKQIGKALGCKIPLDLMPP